MLKCLYIGLCNNPDNCIFKGHHKDMCVIWKRILDGADIAERCFSLKIFVVSYYLKMILKSP